MSRVKRGVTARARHKKVLDQAKGYRGRRKNLFRVANEAVIKAEVSTSTVTVVSASASSGRSGSCGSTPPPTSSESPTAVSSTG